MKSRREILLHPVRMQILQHLMRNGSATPGQLSEVLPEVPRTTLYRHVNLLHSEGYLKVTREVKIRGTYEREYAVNQDVMRGKSRKEKERQDTFNTLLKMIGDFEDYYERPDSDSEKDMLFFTGNTLRLSDREFSEFLQELFALIAKYDVLSEKPGQKSRSITMISAPVTEIPLKQKKEEQKESKEPKETADAKADAPEAEKPERPAETKAVTEKPVEPSAKQESRTEIRNRPQSTTPRMTFREAMEKLSGAMRITDTASHGGVFEMSADATYNMAGKVKAGDRTEE